MHGTILGLCCFRCRISQVKERSDEGVLTATCARRFGSGFLCRTLSKDSSWHKAVASLGDWAMTKRTLLLSAWLVAAFSGFVNAEPITSPSQMNGCNWLIDFESLPIGALSNPVTIEDVVCWTPGDGLGIASVAEFGANGGHVEENTLVPRPTGTFVGAPYADIEMTLPVPASEIAMGWFDSNFSGNRVEVYDSNGALIEAIAVNTFPTGGCCADFVGIRRPTAEIFRVVAHVSNGNDVYSIDKFRVTYGAVVSPTLSDICLGDTATFSVTTAGDTPLTYQWRKSEVPIDSLVNPSAATENLTITQVQFMDAGSYDCIITKTCGSVTSKTAILSISGTGDMNADGNLLADDSPLFVEVLIDPAAFENNHPGISALRGDMNCDGFLDGRDIQGFVNALLPP